METGKKSAADAIVIKLGKICHSEERSDVGIRLKGEEKTDCHAGLPTGSQ